MFCVMGINFGNVAKLALCGIAQLFAQLKECNLWTSTYSDKEADNTNAIVDVELTTLLLVQSAPFAMQYH